MIFEGLLTKSLPLFDARVSIESSQFGEMTSDDSYKINDSFWLSIHIFSHFRVFRYGNMVHKEVTRYSRFITIPLVLQFKDFEKIS